LGRGGDVPCVDNVSYSSFAAAILTSLSSSSRHAVVAAFRLCESYQQGSSTQDKLVQKMLENRNKQWWRGRKSNNSDEDNIVYGGRPIRKNETLNERTVLTRPFDSVQNRISRSQSYIFSWDFTTANKQSKSAVRPVENRTVQPG
jgi:hypothetical protein